MTHQRLLLAPFAHVVSADKSTWSDTTDLFTPMRSHSNVSNVARNFPDLTTSLNTSVLMDLDPSSWVSLTLTSCHFILLPSMLILMRWVICSIMPPSMPLKVSLHHLSLPTQKGNQATWRARRESDLINCLWALGVGCYYILELRNYHEHMSSECRHESGDRKCSYLHFTGVTHQKSFTSFT